MFWATVAVIGGIALIVLSADKFVEGAASLASRLGMSHLLIGLTIISIGTSAPELLVSAVAAFNGSPSLALGNALGSNITNIALVLGATACIFPLIVPRKLVKTRNSITFSHFTIIFALAYRGIFDLLAGSILLAALPVILYYLSKDELGSWDNVEIHSLSLGFSIVLTLGGLTVLLGSSEVLVWGAVEIARFFGVSELVIGLTIVAIGTSLPELAASVAAALKNKTNMAFGTVIGSNIFNSLGVIGIASIISPFAIEPEVLQRDLPWTLGLTLLLYLLARFSERRTFTRSYGILFASSIRKLSLAFICNDRAESMSFIESAKRTIHLETEAVSKLTDQLSDSFNRACEICLACQGRIVVTGMGKSGHIGNKIAATLASTGTPAFFMHPAEASHGDLGMLTSKDVVLALSNSGHSSEIVMLLPLIQRIGTLLISMTRDPNSTLGQASDAHLLVSVTEEACPLNLAPTSSTTAALVMGDALAIALLEARGFSHEDFAFSHPSGALGRKLLLKVEDIMHSGDALPKSQTIHCCLRHY